MTSEALPKILCVDDELSILQSLQRVFKPHFDVLVATSPASGLDLLAQNTDCAVILTDFRMPEMTGIEFLRAARKIAPDAARAILSGQIDMQQISEAINTADIHKFLMKPWENDRLVLHMLEALQTHSTLTEKGHYQRLAITDPVTQLTNHRYFQDRLREEIRLAEPRNSPVSLLMIDVDNFKSFNDRFGHPEGDQLLFAVAARIQKEIGGAGVLSRYGGEEFAAILPGLDLARAREIGESIRTSFESAPISGLSTGATYITLSLGLAQFPDHGKTAKDLIEAADRALYQAKRQGRNQLTIVSSKLS